MPRHSAARLALGLRYVVAFRERPAPPNSPNRRLLRCPGAHGDAGPRPCQVGFAQDEQLLLHTDGVTEARDEDGHF
ncbi:SpoIIE family protein phosphatase [Streptomyces scabiei]|uniref:SpoIIE family protein phosphatase n=1 Tax=Streptomyces scabiei TaxID=1930 RepID=UPI000A4BA529|nr:SpoIIE family protein phosphatase [Streptomyces scabiei]